MIESHSGVPGVLRNLLRLGLCLGMFLMTLPSPGQQDSSSGSFADPSLGVRLTLPDATWKKIDQSQGNVKVLIFSADPQMATRCTIMSMPKVFLANGILSREEQLKAIAKKAYKRRSLTDSKLGNRDARRLEYTIGPSKTIEWEIQREESYLLIQLASRGWQNPQTRKMLEAIRDSVELTDVASATEKVKPKTATVDDVRRARMPSSDDPSPSLQVISHELLVRIEPERQALSVSDHITFRSRDEGQTEATLYTSVMTVTDVSGPEGMTWKSVPRKTEASHEDAKVRELVLTFAEALPKDKDVTVKASLECDDFIHAIDQQLVAEVAVLGQVRPNSSYSSHVVYYPNDATKRGTVDMTLSVPAGMTAVTGGELVSTRAKGGRQLFRYKSSDGRGRLLPFGFAAANYIQRSGKSNSGLRLTFYGYAGEEKLLDQRVDAAVEAANLFEKMMGPLPWKDVRFAHVTPVRKETGVSLPGLILISDRFFADFSNVDVSDGNLQNRDNLSLLVVADELSHQWNAYAVPLPNQLAEGISTFTNVLFMERRAGKETFNKAIRNCRTGYFMSTGLGHDVAIADPAVYQTAAYRGIVFTKTAVALAMLREKIGDDVFFKAWRDAFQDFAETRDGFEVVETAFSKAAGEDLKWFFDQWFYRPGWPKLKISHDQNGNRVSVRCEQIQEGQPFRFPVKLIAKGRDDNATRFVAQLSEVTDLVELDCPFTVETVEIDPNEIGLVEQVKK